MGALASNAVYTGLPAQGAVAGRIALPHINGSISGFNSLTLRFSAEQWRNGGKTAALLPVY